MYNTSVSLEMGHNISTGDGDNSSLYFEGGNKKIDYVFVYKSKDFESGKVAEMRENFREDIEEIGIEVEVDEGDESDGDKRIRCYKLHATWELLCKFAEILKLMMPLKVHEIKTHKDIFIARKMHDILFTNEDHRKMAPFKIAKAADFMTEPRDMFFTSTQRSQLLWAALQCYNKYDGNSDDDNFEVKPDIKTLLTNGTFKEAYPLHDDDYDEYSGQKGRKWLLENWATLRKVRNKQPLEEIKAYFGEKFAIYFSWLGYYTFMLIFPAIVSIGVFMYGLVSSIMIDDDLSKEVCGDDVGNITMCPLCDSVCPYWHLRDSCNTLATYPIFNNEASILFSIFMVLTVTLFLELWKRNQNEINYDWDLFYFEEGDRPEFEAKAKHSRVNQVTQSIEPFVPRLCKWSRLLGVILVTFLMILVVVAAVFGIILYRISVALAFSQRFSPQTSSNLVGVTSGIINYIGIKILGTIYEKIACWLTVLECQRTDARYEKSYTQKLFLFQFVNNYACLFYIAFIKGKLQKLPNQIFKIGGTKGNEACDANGSCMTDLLIQLATLMACEALKDNIVEYVMPIAMNYLRRKCDCNFTKNAENLSQWKIDYRLQPQDILGLFDEYIKMVIQFGYVTIFVVAFPLAPLLALINNILEIRLDANKFIKHYRRPFPDRAQNIGVWLRILKGVTAISVVSNAFIIAFTSDIITQEVYKRAVSPTGSMVGYTNHSLSIFYVKDFLPGQMPNRNLTKGFGDSDIIEPETCRFHGYYAHSGEPGTSESTYTLTTFYWHSMAANLAFVIAFEHVVFLLQVALAYAIPDMPGHVAKSLRRRQERQGNALNMAFVTNNNERQLF